MFHSLFLSLLAKQKTFLLLREIFGVLQKPYLLFYRAVHRDALSDVLTRLFF